MPQRRRAVTPQEFFSRGLATLAEAVKGARISYPTAFRASSGKPLRMAAAAKLEAWSRRLKSPVYVGAAEAVFPAPRRGRPRQGGTSPREFFALGLRGTYFSTTVRDSGISHNLVAKARRGESIGGDAAAKLESWSRKLPSARRAGAFIDRVLAVWPDRAR